MHALVQETTAASNHHQMALSHCLAACWRCPGRWEPEEWELEEWEPEEQGLEERGPEEWEPEKREPEERELEEWGPAKKWEPEITYY